MRTIPPSELERLFHAAMPEPAHWSVVRYEMDVDYATGLPEALVLTFRSDNGAFKRLRFAGPRMEEFGPLKIPASTRLYVADLAGIGWENGAGIEVGEWEEDRSILFWARSVEELPDPSSGSSPLS
jgi:hypothetical protein